MVSLLHTNRGFFEYSTIICHEVQKGHFVTENESRLFDCGFETETISLPLIFHKLTLMDTSIPMPILIAHN